MATIISTLWSRILILLFSEITARVEQQGLSLACRGSRAGPYHRGRRRGPAERGGADGDLTAVVAHEAAVVQ